MHIEQSSPAEGFRKAHRHLLALPVMVLALAVASVGHGQLQAQMTTDVPEPPETIIARQTDTPVAFSDGAYGLLKEDSVLHSSAGERTLERGTLFIASDGLLGVRAADVRLAAFHGGFLVSTNGTSLTVHALTSPVLLSHGAFRMIIPMGMQGEWKKASALPSHVALVGVAEQWSSLQTLSPAVLREELRVLRDLTPAVQQTLEEEGMTQQELSRLEELRAVLASGAVPAIHKALRDPAVRTILSSGHALPALIAQAKALPSAVEEIITHLRDADLWLLLSFHPDFRAAAWETPGPMTIPVSARVVRLLQLPSSATGEGIEDSVIARWKTQTMNFLKFSDAPNELLKPLLSSLYDYHAYLEQNDYPERLRTIAAALRDIVEPYRKILSDESVTFFAAWENVDAISPYIDPPPVPVIPAVSSFSSSSASSTEPGPFDAEAAEAQAKQMLLQMGALFTLKTSLQAESASRVAVTDLLFASQDGEHSFAFTIDLQSGQALGIERDGELLPYSLSLEALAKWAKEGSR